MSIKLLFLAGSARKESFNKKLALTASRMAVKVGVEATFIDLADFDMPLYNGDYEEANGLPENAKKLKQLFIYHDGFFIASPEYNSGYSALLKNTIDWLSRPHEKEEQSLIAFSGKVSAISATSPGALGGLRGLVPLRMLLCNINVHVIPAQAAISGAFKAFDNNGDLQEEQQTKMVQNVVQQLIDTTKAMKD
jgi:NAD(P)H-dependent FMN reductase